jgi:hypothetical protein
MLLAAAVAAGRACCAVVDLLCVLFANPRAQGEHLPGLAILCGSCWLVGCLFCCYCGFVLACSCCVAGHCKVVLGCSMCLASFLSFRRSLKGSSSTVSDRSSSRALGWQHGRCRQRPYMHFLCRHLHVDVLCPDNVQFAQSGVSSSVFVSFQPF